VNGRPLVVVAPEPRRTRQIFAAQAWQELTTTFEVVDLTGAHEQLDELLPRAFAIVGQPNLPETAIEKAAELRAILNVEGNFLPNVDYEACFARGIRVLGCGPAFGVPVAEYALGLAIDLARGISREDRAFRAGRERYVEDGNEDSVLLTGADIGLIGFGNLGRELARLLVPFRTIVRAYDPWLPAAVLAHEGVQATPLEDVLRSSRFLFVLATITPESTGLLDATALDLLPDGARLVLASRAPIIDFDALLDRVAAGRLYAAIDVWPDEPVPADHRARALPGLVLSAHRAGGIPTAFTEIGAMVLDDLLLIARGLPPVRMQAAARELVGRYRNRPVSS
jgi:phosphoglycerate dehydrogenase-like enzyme